MSKSLDRRQFLRLSLGVAAAATATACAGPTPTQAPAATAVPPTKAPAAPAATAVPATPAPAATAVPPTAAPKAAAPAACPKGEICIKASTVKLPTDKVTFRWLDSGDTKAVFWKEFFKKYQEAHPNITCQYDGLPWNEIAKIVPLGIQNGNLHDCFSIPLGITSAQAYSEGWLRAFDDLVPDLAELKKNFPPASFIEGINVFGGKTYGLPHVTPKRTGTMLLYNQEYMDKAGFDPLAKPFSWEDYRAAAKKITEQGAGKYYGVIIGGNQLNRWGDVVQSLAEFASGIGQLDYRTGEYAYTQDAYIAAMELLLAIKADGSFFPGYLSINAPQARAQIAQGAAGMILQGLWCLPQWKKDNPTFKWGAAHTPVFDPKKIFPRHISSNAGAEMWIYAKSKNPEIAADILYYRATLEGAYAWNKICGISDTHLFPQALETASDDPRELNALKLQEGMFKLGPDPLIRNPEVAKVNLELKAITPNFNEVIQGLMSGQLTDVKKQFKDLADRANKELDRAIKAAQDKGAKVSRDDYVFKNWDPTKDYTEADYKAL